MKIYQAILKVQTEIPSISKDGTNPMFKNKYVTLGKCLSIVLPILQSNGILFTSSEKDGLLTVKLIHVESGEEMSNEIDISHITEMQKKGSAYTYAQRYGLFALLGLTGGIEHDDDGNESVKPKEVKIEAKRQEFTNQELDDFVDFLKIHSSILNRSYSNESIQKLFINIKDKTLSKSAYNSVKNKINACLDMELSKNEN
jgi:hypothetical protein